MTLKDLERVGIVTRTVTRIVTAEAGTSLLAYVFARTTWVHTSRPRIETARSRFNAVRDGPNDALLATMATKETPAKKKRPRIPGP